MKNHKTILIFLFLPPYTLSSYSHLLLISLHLIFYIVFLPPRLRLPVRGLIPSFFQFFYFFSLMYIPLPCFFVSVSRSQLYLRSCLLFFHLLLLSTSSLSPTLSKLPSSASFSSQIFPTASPKSSIRMALLQTAKLCCKFYHLSVSVVCILYIEDATHSTCRYVLLNCKNCRDVMAWGFV